jgi:opacity protein-like surface antigen
MSQRISRSLILMILMVNALGSAYATGAGFYMGLGAGPATNTAKPQPAQLKVVLSTILVKPRSNQFGARFFLGYQFNNWAAVEFGADAITPTRYAIPENSPPTCSSSQVSTGGFDILGKLMLPVSCFNAFARGGLAVTYFNASGAFTPDFTRVCGRTNHQINYRPAFGLGVGYDLNQNWVVDASWTRIQVGRFIKNVDLYAISLSYHFVDRFCGQFLCDD